MVVCMLTVELKRDCKRDMAAVPVHTPTHTHTKDMRQDKVNSNAHSTISVTHDTFWLCRLAVHTVCVCVCVCVCSPALGTDWLVAALCARYDR